MMTAEMRHELLRLRTSCSSWSLIAEEFNSRFGTNFGSEALRYHYRTTREKCKKAMIQRKLQCPYESEWLAFREYLTEEDKQGLKAEYALDGYELNEEEKLAGGSRLIDLNRPGQDHEATDFDGSIG